MTGSLASHRSPKRALLDGALWGVATRWGMRGLGFANTMVMARLLMPSDYGVVAMAMLMVGLTQAMLDFGVATVLIRKGDVTKEEIDSVWTLQVLEGIGVALLILLSSWPAALYFKEPRVTPILWIMSGCLFVASLGNIGVALARKDLNFALEFRIGIFGKLLGVVATITAGWLLGDYRALVVGIATGYLSGFAMSYLMHPYRPRWNTKHVGEAWHVSKWLLISGVAGFLLRKSDEFIAARIGGASKYGLYNMGADLGQMPTGEIGPVLLRAFLPVLSKIQDDAIRANAAVIKTVSAVNTLTLFVGLTFFALASPATLLLLGPKWADATVFVMAFALISTIQTMYSPVNTLLVLRGHVRAQTMNVWIEFVMFVSVALLLSSWLSLVALAVARIVSTSFNMILTVIIARKRCGLSIQALAAALGRPLLGALIAAGLAHATSRAFAHPLSQLVAGGAIAALVYLAWSIVSWVLVGRPEGLESTIADRIAAWRIGRADRRKQVESV